jgi:hypothetical protein
MEKQKVRQAVAVVLDGGNNVSSCSIKCCLQHVPGNSFPLCSVTQCLFQFSYHATLLFGIALERK